MEFRIGDKVVDLLDNLGVGTIINLYWNFHDNPAGELLATCAFDTLVEEDEEGTICDRSFNEISKDLSLVGEDRKIPILRLPS